MILSDEEINALAGELFMGAAILKKYLSSENQMNSLKIPQLRTICNFLRANKSISISSSGTKKVIISKLFSALENNSVSSRYSPYPPIPSTTASITPTTPSSHSTGVIYPRKSSSVPRTQHSTPLNTSYAALNNYFAPKTPGQRSERNQMEEQIFQKILADKSLSGAISPFFPVHNLIDVVDLTDLQNTLTTTVTLKDPELSQLFPSATNEDPKLQLHILLLTADFKAANWHPDIKVFVNDCLCALPKPKSNSKKKAVVFMTCDPVVSPPLFLVNPTNGESKNKLQIHFLKNYKMSPSFLIIHVAEMKTVDELIEKKKQEFEKSKLEKKNLPIKTSKTQEIPAPVPQVNMPQIAYNMYGQPTVYPGFPTFGQNVIVGPGMMIGNPLYNPQATPLRGTSFNQPQPQLDQENDDEEDDVIVEQKEVVSLLDPLTLMYITIPVKGCGCAHTQPFDLENFLLFAETSCFWNCPVCNKPAPFPEIQIDPKSTEIITTLADEIEKETVEKVIVEEDGKWKPVGTEKVVVKDKEFTNKGNNGNDEEDEDGERKKKEEEDKFHHKNVVEVVELSDEEDSDEERQEKASKNTQKTQPAPAKPAAPEKRIPNTASLEEFLRNSNNSPTTATSSPSPKFIGQENDEYNPDEDDEEASEDNFRLQDILEQIQSTTTATTTTSNGNNNSSSKQPESPEVIEID